MTISINQDPSLVAHHSVGKLTKEPTQLSNQETMNLSMQISAHTINGQKELDSHSQICSHELPKSTQTRLYEPEN